jgi:Holliday junction resolvase RusA-like endonuclease
MATGTMRDLDNQNKLALDALTGNAYEDDSQISELHLYRDYDKQFARIKITLRSFDNYLTRALSIKAVA